MSKNGFDGTYYRSLGDVARMFIDSVRGVKVRFCFDVELNCYCLAVSGSGLFLRDVRCWLPDNISVKYGYTQDVIVFYYNNVL